MRHDRLLGSNIRQSENDMGLFAFSSSRWRARAGRKGSHESIVNTFLSDMITNNTLSHKKIVVVFTKFFKAAWFYE